MLSVQFKRLKVKVKDLNDLGLHWFDAISGVSFVRFALALLSICFHPQIHFCSTFSDSVPTNQCLHTPILLSELSLLLLSIYFVCLHSQPVHKSLSCILECLYMSQLTKKKNSFHPPFDTSTFVNDTFMYMLSSQSLIARCPIL